MEATEVSIKGILQENFQLLWLNPTKEERVLMVYERLLLSLKINFFRKKLGVVFGPVKIVVI